MPLTKVQAGLLEATGTPSAGTFLRGDGSWSGTLVSGTAVTLTNQTAPDLSTSIPSWVKRITVMLRGVGMNGTVSALIQVGSGSYSTSGYLSSVAAINGGTGQAGSTAGIVVTTTGITAVSNFSGAITLSLLNSNQWVASGNLQYSTTAGAMLMAAGYTPALSGALDRIRLFADGTQQFDEGTVNILYEG